MAAAPAALLLALMADGPTRASSFQVNPVNIELQQGRRSASLLVRNRDSQPVSIRVRLFRWTQENGEDVRAEATDLIASPPIFTVAPGARQLIRIGPRRSSPAAAAYRVVLEEIPGPAVAGTGIQVALRVDLPFYILAANRGAAALSWSAWRNRDGELLIEARNSGSGRSQVLGLAAVDSAGREIPLSSQMGVVLPGSARRWNAGLRPEYAAGSELNLSVRGTGGQTSRSRVVLEAR